MFPAIKPLRPNVARANVAFYSMLGIVIIFPILALINFYNAGQYEEYASGGVVSTALNYAKILNADRIVRLVLLVKNLFYIANYILFLMWFYRAYSNYRNISQDAAKGKAWSIIAWFVPIANLFIPYQMVREMGEGNFKVLKGFPDSAKKGLPSKDKLIRLTGWWWGTLIGLGIVARFIGMGDEAKTITEVIHDVRMDAWASALLVLPAIFAALLIKRFHAVEQNVFEIWESGEFEERRQAWMEKKAGQNNSGKEGTWYKAPSEEKVEDTAHNDPFTS